MELECKVLKEILAEQKKTNELLEKLILRGENNNGRTITKQSDVPKSKGTVQRKHGPNRNIQ